MTPRERKMVVLLSALGLVGVVLGFWLLVLTPWQENRALAKQLEEDYATKYAKQTEYEASRKTLRSFMDRSLPGEANAARHEYESLISSLLRSTGVPSGYTVTQKEPGDANRVPTLAPKVPAYSRVGYEIVLRKVDLPTVIRFLEAYYKQPVLQQITRFNIKKGAGDSSDSGAKREARADLEVTIVTEGVAIDGAPKRATLVAVPPTFGVLGGGSGLALAEATIQRAPHLSQFFKPSSFASLLAANRDYALLAAKDPFHGPLPEPKPIEAPRIVKDTRPKEEEKPPPPPDEINAFIRLTGITWRSDGTVSAEVRDTANNYDYDISRRFSLDGDMKITVKKQYFLNGVRKTLESFDDLVIVEDGTTTDRRFKVLDFLPEGLLLTETVFVKDEKPAEEPKVDPKPSPSGSKTNGSKTGSPFGKKPSTSPSTTKGPSPMGAIVGAVAYLPRLPQEKRYVWPIGAPLSKIVELKPANEAAKKLEETPMPRENPQGK